MRTGHKVHTPHTGGAKRSGMAHAALEPTEITLLVQMDAIAGKAYSVLGLAVL